MRTSGATIPRLTTSSATIAPSERSNAWSEVRTTQGDAAPLSKMPTSRAVPVRALTPPVGRENLDALCDAVVRAAERREPVPA